MKNTYALSKRRAYEASKRANRKALYEDAEEFVVMITLKGPDGSYSEVGFADEDTDIDYTNGVYGYDADIRANVFPMTRKDATSLASKIIENAPAGDVIVGVVPYSTIPQGASGFDAAEGEDTPSEEDMEIPGSEDVETSEEDEGSDESEEETEEETEEEPVEESTHRRRHKRVEGATINPRFKTRRVYEEAPKKVDPSDVTQYDENGLEVSKNGKVIGLRHGKTPKEVSNSAVKQAAINVMKKLVKDDKDIYMDVVAADDDEADIRPMMKDDGRHIVGVFADGEDKPATAYSLDKDDYKAITRYTDSKNMVDSVRVKNLKSKVVENMKRRMGK